MIIDTHENINAKNCSTGTKSNDNKIGLIAIINAGARNIILLLDSLFSPTFIFGIYFLIKYRKYKNPHNRHNAKLNINTTIFLTIICSPFHSKTEIKNEHIVIKTPSNKRIASNDHFLLITVSFRRE